MFATAPSLVTEALSLPQMLDVLSARRLQQKEKAEQREALYYDMLNAVGQGVMMGVDRALSEKQRGWDMVRPPTEEEKQSEKSFEERWERFKRVEKGYIASLRNSAEA